MFEEKKDSVPKYFTENVYKELAKSLNDFQKDTSARTDNVANQGVKENDEVMKRELLTPPDSRSTYAYAPLYYLNQPMEGKMYPGPVPSSISKYQPFLNKGETVLSTEGDVSIPEKGNMNPKDDYSKTHLGNLESTRHFDQTMGLDIGFRSSPETSPNLIAASCDKYIKPDCNLHSMVHFGDQRDLGGVVSLDKAQGCGSPFKTINYDHSSVTYPRGSPETKVANQPYYYPREYNHSPLQKHSNDEIKDKFMIYNPGNKVFYMNNIRAVYDEKTKSYYPNYEVVDDNSQTLNYRHNLIPNGELQNINYETTAEEIRSGDISPMFKYLSQGPGMNVNDLYENTESYYKNTSLKQNIMEGLDEIDPRSIKRRGSDKIAYRLSKDKVMTQKTSSAGRPRLNRNHYSCSSCQAKSTPQWRYLNGIPVCNACYMRMRKDMDPKFQSNRNKLKKKQKERDA